MTAFTAGLLAATAVLVCVGRLIISRRSAERHGRQLVRDYAVYEHLDEAEGPREALRRLSEVNDELDASPRHARSVRRRRLRRQMTSHRPAGTPPAETPDTLSASSWPPLPPQRRPGTNPSSAAPRRSPRV